MITAAADKTVRVWDVQSKQQVAEFNHTENINNAIMSKGNRYIFSICFNVVHPWNFEVKQKVLSLPDKEMLYSASITSDMEYIVLGFSNPYIKIWSFESKLQKAY